MSWELNEGFSPIIHACNLQLSLIASTRTRKPLSRSPAVVWKKTSGEATVLATKSAKKIHCRKDLGKLSRCQTVQLQVWAFTIREVKERQRGPKIIESSQPSKEHVSCHGLKRL